MAADLFRNQLDCACSCRHGRWLPRHARRINPRFPGWRRAFISMQRGGSSKDTWIASATAVEADTLLHAPGKMSNCVAPETICRRVWRIIFLAGPLLRTRRRHCALAADFTATLQSRTRGRGDAADRAVTANPQTQGQLPGILDKPSCAKTPRRSRRNCSRRSLIRHDPEVCGRSRKICSGLAMLVRTAPRTTCGAS